MSIETILLIIVILSFIQSQAALVFACVAISKTKSDRPLEWVPTPEEEELLKLDHDIALKKAMEAAKGKAQTPTSYETHRKDFDTLMRL